MTARIDALQAQLCGPRDGALLRYALGAAWLDAGDSDAAITHLRRALEFDANYSAAWSLLGKAHLQRGDADAAGDAWRQGITAAKQRGDVQAAKVMQVLLRRLSQPR